jgi:uncharacterized protein
MMSFKRNAIFTLVLAMTIVVMVLAAGCQSADAAKANTGNNPKSATLDSAKAMTYSAADQTTGSTNGISVTGQGKITLKPDVAIITLGVQTTDADAAKARKANNDAMAKVLAALKGFGIAGADITTTDFSINPTYNDKGDKITGYTVSNTLSVKVKALDKLGDVLTAASTAGANTSGGISFDILDRTAAYNQALAQAMDKAKARADIMAKACGVTLGKALTISESSSYSGPVFAAANESVAAGDTKSIAVPVSSGSLDVSASVNVVYEIVK